MQDAVSKLGPTATTSYHGSIGLGCSKCVYLPFCGGLYDGFSCLDYCCNKPEECQVACPNSHRFAKFYYDAGGFFPRAKRLVQNQELEIPQYVPLVHHRYSRGTCLQEDIVALPTVKVLALWRHWPDLTASQLRDHFKVAGSSKLLLISVAPDHLLEPIWRDMETKRIPRFLKGLKIEHITAPNFSFPDDLPRTEGLTNIARIIKASEQLSQEGLSVIPHLNATHERQWQHWTAFLREHKEITTVAKEFQTGLSAINVARWHMQKLTELQQTLGRPIRLWAIGGRRYMDSMLDLAGFSVIDSRPFLQTVHRNILTFPNGTWKLERSRPGDLLDKRLQQNIDVYRKGIEEKVAVLRGGAHRKLEQSQISMLKRLAKTA